MHIVCVHDLRSLAFLACQRQEAHPGPGDFLVLVAQKTTALPARS